MMNVKNHPKAFSLLIICIIFFMMLIMNTFTPLYADDYSYSFSFYDATKITSFTQIFYSQAAHYFTMNGRLITHFLAQYLLLLGKPAFNWINSLAFCLLGWLMTYHAVGKNPLRKPLPLLMSYCCLFLFHPGFGESILWLDSAATYLYGFLIALLFLTPFRYALAHPESQKGGTLRETFKLIGMFLFAIIAGMTSELSGGAMLAAWVLYCAYFLFGRKQRLSCWMYSGAALAVGLVFILLSPGQQSRMDGRSSFGIAQCVKNFVVISCSLLENFYIPFALLIILMLLYGLEHQAVWKTPANWCILLKPCIPSFIYLTAGVAAAYAMMPVNFFALRAWMTPTCMIIISLVSAFDSLMPVISQKIPKQIYTGVIVLCCAATLACYMLGVKEVKWCKEQDDYRRSLIIQAQECGQRTVEIPSIASFSRFSCFTAHQGGDLNWESSQWPNTSIADYFGMERIVRNDTLRK